MSFYSEVRFIIKCDSPECDKVYEETVSSGSEGVRADEPDISMRALSARMEGISRTRLAELLRLSGWQLTDPEKRGKMHYPLIDHGLIRHFDKDIHIEGGDCFVDCSGGEPELELSEGIEEEEAKVKLMANLPTRFLGVERSYSDLRQEGAEIRQLLTDILEIQKINALILSEQTKAESLKYQPIPPRSGSMQNQGQTEG